jgi:DNA-directed RNA polymerase specialized sigma24 family protein
MNMKNSSGATAMRKRSSCLAHSNRHAPPSRRSAVTSGSARDSIEPDAWSRLLAFLAVMQERAPGDAYERTHERLVRFFRARGSTHPEELADITFDRLAIKLSGETSLDARNAITYLLAMARLIWLESLKRESSHRRALDKYAATGGDDDETADIERDLALIEHCLADMPHEQRTLLLQYYRGRGQPRIACRRQLGRELQLTPGLLRTRVHRLRTQLERRVKELIALNHESQRA